MKTALVGYTGFVGANLLASNEFDYKFNSKNIEEAYGLQPDLLIYSGIRAEMFIANANPEEDFLKIKEAIDNIQKINAKRVVLISTVAVYDRTVEVDETTCIDESKLLPYGRNRLFLEKWVSENCENSLIVRLPAIYGTNLKKNFLYDFINVCPAMLNKSKYEELMKFSKLIENYYLLENDGFYHCCAHQLEERKALRDFFTSVGFSALNFTDSRSIYQFYNLNNLWRDINKALDHNVSLLNIVTEPISVCEVYKYLTGKTFVNELTKEPFDYRIRSVHSTLFGGDGGYLENKSSVLNAIRIFVNGEIKRVWE